MDGNYVKKIVDQLAEFLPGAAKELLRFYALLVLVRGRDVTTEDVHHAMSAWRMKAHPDDQLLVPYAGVPDAIKREYFEQQSAIWEVANRQEVT